MLCALVNQHAVARNRKAGLLPAQVADLRDKNHSFTAELKTARIKRLCHERAIVRE